jgi:hypothetical protein
MNEELEKARQMIAAKFEYQVAQSDDAFLHHHLLVPYLLVRILGELEEVNLRDEPVKKPMSAFTDNYRDHQLQAGNYLRNLALCGLTGSALSVQTHDYIMDILGEYDLGGTERKDKAVQLLWDALNGNHLDPAHLEAYARANSREA